ncbi:hypothetical protein MBANPS3_005157 [Mucor bainieri]
MPFKLPFVAIIVQQHSSIFYESAYSDVSFVHAQQSTPIIMHPIYEYRQKQQLSHPLHYILKMKFTAFYTTTVAVLGLLALANTVQAQVGYPCDIDADCLEETFCDRRNTHRCVELKPVFFVVDDIKKGN